MSSLREDGSVLSVPGALKLALREHELLWTSSTDVSENKIDTSGILNTEGEGQRTEKRSNVTTRRQETTSAAENILANELASLEPKSKTSDMTFSGNFHGFSCPFCNSKFPPQNWTVLLREFDSLRGDWESLKSFENDDAERQNVRNIYNTNFINEIIDCVDSLIFEIDQLRIWWNSFQDEIDGDPKSNSI